MHHLPSRYIPCDGRLTASAYFKSTLPAWGATKWTPVLSPAYTFQSTLPVGGTTLRFVFTDVFSNISIHAPRMGSDWCIYLKIPLIAISIHAPRMGSDKMVCLPAALSQDFNPRSPHGERLLRLAFLMRISNFNPRSPHGERRDAHVYSNGDTRFQSTLPAWGATLESRRYP